MFKPYDLALMQVQVSARLRPVEIISRPIPAELSKPETIMVRMVPGDPTTMVEVSTNLLRKAPRKRRYCHVAEVTTNFPFPEDMLRYDDAALCDWRQQEELEDSVGRPMFRPDAPVLVYRLDERKTPDWTTARWQSFQCVIRHKLTLDLWDHSRDFVKA